MLNLLPIPANDIIMYMNILFLGFIVLGALVGFCRGTMKSIYFLIMTLIIFVGGWFLMGPITKGLMNLDLSSFGLTFQGVVVETPLQFVKEMLVQQFPEWDLDALLAPGSYTYALVTGMVDMIFKVVYVLLLIILSFTLFWIINGIIWLIVRIPFRKIFCKPIIKKNGKKKYRANFFSRLGGAGIGAVKGLLYTLLLGFILAGLASVSDSIKEIASSGDGQAVVVVNDNTFTVIEVTDGSDPYPGENEDKPGESDPYPGEGDNNPYPDDSSNGNNPFGEIMDQYGDVLDVLSGYRQTISGKVFGAIKIGKGDDKATFDEYVFDKIFSVEGKDAQVKLRNELRILARALSNDAIKELMNGNFDITKLAQLDKEELNSLIETISSLKTIKVVFPVGLEIITYTNILEQALGEQYDSVKDLLEANIEDLLKLDACNQAKSLGYVFVDVLDLLKDNLDDPSKIDFLNFDQETLNHMFETLGNMDLIKVVAPIAINYLVSTDAVKDAIEQAGFTIEDLGLADLTGDDYVKELMNLPKIYEKIVDLGIKQVEGQIDLSGIDPSKVAGLTEQLFTSVILSNAIDVVAYSFLTNPEYLPQQFQGIFSEEELKATNWKDEFTPLLTAAASLLKSGILDAEDPIKALTSMSDDDFADLGRYLSQSNLITNNLNELLDVVMTEINLEGIKFEGLNKELGEEWNETEIVSLFKSVKVILDSGIITADDPMEALKTLSDATINDLAHNLSQSIYITKNLNSIIDVVMANAQIEGFEIVGLDPTKGERWDETELKSLFGAFKTILGTDLINSPDPIQAFKKISDEDIDKLATDLSNSKFFTKNLDGIIDFAIKQIDNTLQLETLDASKGEVWNKEEIKSVFSSLKTIVSTGILDDQSDLLNKVKELKDQTIEELATSLSHSKFMTKNISNLLSMFTGDLGFELAKLEQSDWTTNEIYSVFKSLTIIADASSADGNINIENILNLSDDQLGVLLESKLLSESLKNIIVEKSKPGQDLEILKGVYDDGVNENGVKVYDWLDNKVLTSSKVNASGILDITPVTNALKYIVYKNNCYFTTTTEVSNIDLTKFNEYTYNANDDFTVKAIVENGELRRAFNAISALEIKDLSGGVDIDLRNVSKNKQTLLESYVLTETLIDQIRALDNDNTDGILEINPSFKAGGDGNWHGEDGELNSIINALDVALGLSTSKDPVSINGLDFNSLSIKKIIDSRETIFTSTIVTETVITKIQELDGEVFKLATEYKDKDLSVWKDTNSTKGELSILFDVIGKVIKLPETGFEIDANSIDLGEIVREREEVLKSAVITTTVVDKIANLTTLISIPEKYKVKEQPSWALDYDLWKNTYINGTVSQIGELDHLLNSLGIVLDAEHKDIIIDNITEDSISLADIIKNDKLIFDSQILTATVVNKVQELGNENTILIPEEYRDDYEYWNKDNSNELILLLDALNYVVKLPETGFNIDTTNILLNDVYTNRNEILKSAVLTSTIVDKVTGLTAITVPTEYKLTSSHKWESDYDLWKNTYVNGEVSTTGELDDLLNAINLTFDLTNHKVNIQGIDPNNINLNNIIANSDSIFNSQILTATVVDKVQELGKDNTIIIPKEFKDDYKYWNKDNSNELVLLLNALGCVVDLPEKGFAIDTSNIILNKIHDNSDKILKSAVLTSTIVDKVINVNSITIPEDYKVNPTHEWNKDYDLWKNTYVGDKVSKTGELNDLLNSLAVVLSLSKTNQVNITDINISNISLDHIIKNDKVIFDSQILTATVVNEVQDLGTKNLIVIPQEYQGDYKYWNKDNSNELVLLLDALSYVVELPKTGFEVNTNTISINNVYDNKDEILKSAILTTTIVDKVAGLSAITIPDEYKVNKTHKWNSDYNLWKNTYLNNEVSKTGELDSLLNAIYFAFDLKNNKNVNILDVDPNNISLKNIIDNSSKVFESQVLSATVVNEIQTLGTNNTIIIPKEFKGDYKYWSEEQSNELIYLLDSLNLSLQIPNTGFDIDPSTINMKNLLGQKDEILKSAVLTATIVDKISKFTIGITVPEEYKVPSTREWDKDYEFWKNKYPNGKATEHHELSYMLGSIDAILNITGSKDDVLIDDLAAKLDVLYLENIISKKDVILHSKIVNLNIVDQIRKLGEGPSGISIPDGYKATDPFTNWENTYDSNDDVITYGETSRLLGSLKLTLGLTDDPITPIDAISLSSFELSNVTKTKNRDNILYSEVISETLKDQFIKFDQENAITLPNNYDISTSKNYIVWKNTYDEKGTVTTTGELSHLLGAVDLIAGPKATMTNFSDLNFAAIFDRKLNTTTNIIPQDEILKSKVISETIIDKLVSTLSIPTDSKLNLNNVNDRTNWYNDYSGSLSVERKELANLIDSLNQMISPNQKGNLDKIDINEVLDNIVKGFTDDNYKKTVLNSYVISETIKVNVVALNAFKNGSPINQAFIKNYGSPSEVNVRTRWYDKDSSGNVLDRELWHLLTSSAIILGDTGIKGVGEFQIENIIHNENMEITYDKNYVVAHSNIELMLQSIVIEQIFAGIAENVISVKLSGTIVEPEGGYNWYKIDADKNKTEHDLRTFLESYYIVSKYLNPTDILKSAETLLVLNEAQLNDLAAGLVISRTFRGSMANMFNTILGTVFKAQYIKNHILEPNVQQNAETEWAKISFKQIRYNEPYTKVQAHDNFVKDYTKVCNAINGK